MVRDPWMVAVALFAFGVIVWVVAAERPSKSPVRVEAAHTLSRRPLTSSTIGLEERSPCYARNDDRAARIPGSLSEPQCHGKDHLRGNAHRPGQKARQHVLQ